AELGASRLHIQSDSELLVKQMNGQYRVKQPDLKILYGQAKDLSERFQDVRITHVRREQNRRADELCNQALDGERGGNIAAAPRKERPGPTVSSQEESARQQALECLQAAATEWSKGDPNMPAALQVLDQIWSIWEEEGLLRSRRHR